MKDGISGLNMFLEEIQKLFKSSKKNKEEIVDRTISETVSKTVCSKNNISDREIIEKFAEDAVNEKVPDIIIGGEKQDSSGIREAMKDFLVRSYFNELPEMEKPDPSRPCKYYDAETFYDEHKFGFVYSNVGDAIMDRRMDAIIRGHTTFFVYDDEMEDLIKSEDKYNNTIH